MYFFFFIPPPCCICGIRANHHNLSCGQRLNILLVPCTVGAVMTVFCKGKKSNLLRRVSELLSCWLWCLKNTYCHVVTREPAAWTTDTATSPILNFA